MAGHRRHFVVTAGIVTAVLLAGCGGGESPSTSPPAGPTTSAESQPSSADSPSASAPSASDPSASAPSTDSSDASSPAASSPSSASPAAPAKKRTAAQLRKALLSLKDVPPGLEKLPAGEDDGGQVSSARAACAPLVNILNADRLPGSTASTGAAFAGGPDGPFIEETLDAMGTSAKAAAFIDRYRQGVRDCRSIKLSLPGVGTSTLAAREISFAKIGDRSFAGRFTASSGDLEGFELIQVGVQSGDVVVGVTAVGLDPADAEAAAEDAVAKVEDTLGDPGSA